ncbi:SGNH/GDSL hydrolase family protein [Streptomyces chilikensis]|uniref:SGNH/GDSL hydrolase family protein n=1 Tax=Streptomyces chilikensis TaxID=1194079 RepID=UPI00140C482A|nr:SGNH/GDSL hydrolase family protein [Streptomyces chilikensis]
MPHPARRPRRTLAAALAASAVALGLAVQPAQAADPLRYVALGDSYSAGSGVSPTDFSSPLCLRSKANYPKVIAGRTGADLTDVTCGAAQTKHFTQSQYPLVPPQADAVNADTDLITLTIGGNDNSTFIGALLACGSAGLTTGGYGNPCETLHGSRFTDAIDDHTYPALRSALAAVKAKAPHARIAVLGYPWITPASFDPTCFAKLPVARGDIPYLRGLQSHLNDTIARAARESGAVYIDFAQVSEGHDACKAPGTRWIEPVLGGNSIVPVHPNALGESRMADHTMTVLGLG